MINFQIETNINCGWETSTTRIEIEYLIRCHFHKQIHICKVLYLVHGWYHKVSNMRVSDDSLNSLTFIKTPSAVYVLLH